MGLIRKSGDVPLLHQHASMTKTIAKEVAMPKALPYLRLLPLVVAGFLLLLLLISISGCTVSAGAPAATQELPTLQAILPFDTPALNPKYVSVLPGGYTYVTEEQGAIIVLQGTKLVTVIPLPPGEKPFGYSQPIAFHPKTKIGYLPNANTDNLYIIQGTEIITILRNISDGPIAVGINQHTGLTYLANIIDPLGLTILDGTEVVTRLATSFPKVIAADPNSAKVYIGQDISRDSPRKEQGLLAVVDATKLLTLTNLNYEQDIPDSLGGAINAIAIDRHSGEIYMIQNLGTVIYWYNGQIKRIKLGRMGHTGLHDIAVDPTRGLAYVSSWGRIGSYVAVLKQGEFVTALHVGRDPRTVVYDAMHDYVYVASRLGHSLAVIRDTQVISNIEARGNAMGLGVDETGGYIYLASPDSHNITIFGFAKEIKQPSFWDFLPWINR